ncbi:hypothetical protein K0U91_06695 [Chryseobacterium chendengshani]|uniref:hypothetical protein n=1 Tax=Chryseobacterium sp. LJ668 TaxID=2864040 RepID=UPI001C690E1C|nr:hypothetical protein [Chryseobacterium sp. LJ668]MBW8522154.1 hypothetical protein [Chryseobacterium sp. LJ668]QYK17801.1 hypothetical protein K0U91_06695 [Chryseobacterium sp. LJ668]
MADYIKICLMNIKLIDLIWSNPKLTKLTEYSYGVEETGEWKTIFTKMYKNMMFKKFENRLEISGSLHYLKNDGVHNCDDFTPLDCINTIISFCNLFGITPELCKITALEFGLNIELPMNIKDFLSHLRFLGRKQFRRDKVYDDAYFVGTSYFGLKIYNKSIQFPKFTPPNLLRIEWTTKESKFLNSNKIFTLDDLLNPETYIKCSEIILKKWNDLIIFDSLKSGKEYFYTEFWLNILDNSCRETFSRKKKRYYQLLGRNSIHSKTFRQILKKVQDFNHVTFSTVLSNLNYVQL